MGEVALHVFQASVELMGSAERKAGDALTLAQAGEGAALARILPLLPAPPLATLGPGDDAAVLATPDSRVVISCDMMIEGPDFRTDWSTLQDVGYKAVASNTADIAAMGAVTTGFEIAVAAPGSAHVRDLVALAEGFAEGIAAMAPQAGVLGGDLSHAPVWTIAVTVLGDLEGRQPVTRSGAKRGHILALAGECGLSHEGLTTLRAGVSDEVIRDPAVIRHLRPTPPLALGPTAARAGATAMMDVSDGVVLDATRMATASGVTLRLDSSQEWNEHSLFGGEDHGLLACFPSASSVPEGFRVIGEVVDAIEGARVVLEGWNLQESLGGWDPFAT